MMDGAVATASVDVCCYGVGVPRDLLTHALRRKLSGGDTLARRIAPTLTLESPDGTQDLHPVVIESWKIQKGEAVFGGLEQGAWARSAGSMFGAMAALAFPQRQDNVPAALTRGALAGAKSADKLVDAAQRRFGEYSEVVVLVPFVRIASLVECVSFVARMHTGNGYARGIDRFLGYGFAKLAAQVDHDADGLRVAGPDRRSELQTTNEQLTPSETIAAPSHWAQPFLGLAPSGRLALSRMHRVPSASRAALRTELKRGSDLSWLLPQAAYTIEPSTDASVLGGRQLRDVRCDLSAPRGLE